MSNSPPPTSLPAVLKSQYRSALHMLAAAIEKCPDALWTSTDSHAAPYWRIAFHVLFFTHFYLQPDKDHMSRWPKHRDHLQDLSGPPADPADVYTRQDMLDYLAFCRQILDPCIDAMDLASPDCGFPWYRQGKLEHQLNNLRHLQHHTAQLADRLRAATAQGIDWPTAPV